MKFFQHIYLILFSIAISSCGVSHSSVKTEQKDSTTVQKNMRGISSKSPEQIKLESLIIDGQKAEFNGDLQLAEINYYEVLKSDPDNATANFRLANLYFDLGNYASAETVIINAVKTNPTNKWMLLLEAKIFDTQSKYEKAAEVYQNLLTISPDDLDNYFSLAFELSQNKNYQDAIDVYDMIENKIGVDEQVSIEKQKLYDDLQKPDKAILEIVKLVDAFPAEARYYALLADAYNLNNQKDEAMSIIQKLVKVDPDNPQAQLALYNYYRNNGNLIQAFVALKKVFQSPSIDVDTKIGILVGFLPYVSTDESQKNQAIDLASILVEVHPNSAKALALKGDVFSQAGDFSTAISSYKKSIQIDESHFGIWQQVMSLYAQQKQFDSMLVYSQKAAQLFPEQLMSYIFNGVALQNTKHYSEAVESFNMVTTIGTDDKSLMSDVYKSLGDCYHLLNQNIKSDSCYRKALFYLPNNVYVLNNFSYFLSLRNENLQEAYTMVQKLNQLQPNIPVYEDTYAWVLYKMKNYSEAKLWIQKAVAGTKTPSADMYDHYGDILFMNGDENGAVINWQLAKQAGLLNQWIDKKIADKKLYE